jgi:hypothetical protein
MYSISIWELSQELVTNFIYQQAFRLLYLLLHRTSCVVRRRISFITLLSLCLSHDIFILHHTYTKQKRVLSQVPNNLSFSLSLSFYDDDDSQPPLFSSSFAFFSSSTYRYNRNEKVYIYVSVGFQDDENESNACFMYKKYFILSQREEKKRRKDM